jgi:small subunit ribosomal protein S17e
LTYPVRLVASMGKQKSKVLASKAGQLYEMFPDKFSTDFEKNKASLRELEIFTSKTDRNIAAGVITRMIKKKQD